MFYFRFPKMVRPGKRKHEETLDPLTGTHRVSKWGPKYNLSQIGLNIPAYIADGIATSLATSTWSTYKTALNMFRKYKNVSRNSMTIACVTCLTSPCPSTVRFRTYYCLPKCRGKWAGTTPRILCL